MGLALMHQELYRQRVSDLQAFRAQLTALNFTCAEQPIGMHAGEEEKPLEALDKL